MELKRKKMIEEGKLIKKKKSERKDKKKDGRFW